LFFVATAAVLYWLASTARDGCAFFYGSKEWADFARPLLVRRSVLTAVFD